MIKDRNIDPNAAVSLSKIQTLANGTISAQASTADLATTDFGKVVTNTGASNTIILTLPSAVSVAGLSIKVQITAAQIVSLSPAATEAVYLGGNGVVNKDLSIAGVIGNYADIYSDGSNYLVINYSGVLTKEA